MKTFPFVKQDFARAFHAKIYCKTKSHMNVRLTALYLGKVVNSPLHHLFNKREIVTGKTLFFLSTAGMLFKWNGRP